MLLDGDEVGKGLQGVHGGRLHGKDGAAAVLLELLKYAFLVVFLLVVEAGKGAHPYQVAVASHHGDGFEHVLALVAVHDHATLGLELPGALVHIEHDYVHSQVHSSFLRAQPGAQAGVEKHHEQGLVLAQVLIGEPIFLDLERLVDSCFQVAYVGDVLKTFHLVTFFFFGHKCRSTCNCEAQVSDFSRHYHHKLR